MRDLALQFARRDAHPAVQFVKYGIGGALASAVDLLGFYAAAIALFPALSPDDPAARLLGLHPAAIAESARSAHYVWDKSISFLFANFTAYLVNIYWVFTPGRHSKAVELALFYAVSGASFAVGTGIGWLLIRSAGLSTTCAYAANLAAAVLINYAGRKYFIFKG